MGRPITNRSNNLTPKMHKTLLQAAKVAAHRFRGLDAGDYVSEGWLRVVRRAEEGDPFLFSRCLTEMKRCWAADWARHRKEFPLSMSIEGLQEGETPDPLTNLMAEEFLMLLRPVDRRLLRLRFWHNLTWKEIGEQFGITYEAARLRFNRVILDLRRKVEA